jgi:hypothetical protein
MKEITLICDDCKRKGKVREYRFLKDKEPDPSGNGLIWNWETKDWCTNCLIWFA